MGKSTNEDEEIERESRMAAWSILWFLIFLFVAWPLAFFIAWLYVLVAPFSVCIPHLQQVSDAVFSLIQFPRKCIENMMRGTRFRSARVDSNIEADTYVT